MGKLADVLLSQQSAIEHEGENYSCSKSRGSSHLSFPTPTRLELIIQFGAESFTTKDDKSLFGIDF